MNAPRPAILPQTADGRVLVVGDLPAALDAAGRLADAAPDLFGALAELADGRHAAVVADFDQIDRPDAAVAALREQITGGRVVAAASDADQVAGADATVDSSADAATFADAIAPPRARPPTKPAAPAGPLPELEADDLLTALTDHPGASAAAAAKVLAGRVAAPLSLSLGPAPAGNGAAGRLHVPLPDDDAGRHLTLALPADLEQIEADVLRHDLADLAARLGKLAAVDARHARLQRLALNDDLTGCANKRYFRHFLDRILKKARAERFPVTLLLFDIDDFKQYNDRHGHPVGDAILRETGQLIRRCVRDHDFVARIGGDEFAVVFWEKPDGEEAAADAEHRRGGGRLPRGPLQIAARFRRLISEPDFGSLGSTGTGRLGISGGMAVFPYDAATADDLIAAADNALLFGAKRTGKNSIALVGDDAEG